MVVMKLTKAAAIFQRVNAVVPDRGSRYKLYPLSGRVYRVQFMPGLRMQFAENVHGRIPIYHELFMKPVIRGEGIRQSPSPRVSAATPPDVSSGVTNKSSNHSKIEGA